MSLAPRLGPQRRRSHLTRLLASVGHDGTVRLWDPVTGQLTTTLKDHSGTVNSLAFSSDGRLLANAGLDGVVNLWDLCSSALVSRLRVEVSVAALAWEPWTAGGGGTADSCNWRSSTAPVTC